jgi:predicted nucleic acid-binding protein
MNGREAFFDTNVLLYLLSDDHGKADAAEILLSKGGVVSVQVLNEFAAVASRKLGMSWPEIRDVLSTVRAVCAVQSLSTDTHERALEVSERYGFSFYDSLIIAAAMLAGCATLYSEDMQDGQKVRPVTVRNPFGA